MILAPFQQYGFLEFFFFSPLVLTLYLCFCFLIDPAVGHAVFAFLTQGLDVSFSFLYAAPSVFLPDLL